MLIEFEAYREQKNEKGIPYLYLLRSQSDKGLYSIIRIDDEEISLVGEGSFEKSDLDIEKEGWEKLSNSRKEVEKYIIENIDTDLLIELENNFFKPDDTNDEKTLLIDFE